MKRFNTVSLLVRKRVDIRDGVMVSHPCGSYAPVSYLRSRPKLSRAVAGDLQQDASFSGDFESEILDMALRGCDIPNSVYRHLKWWRSKGCPHWMSGRKPSAPLAAWWDTYSWVFLPTLSRKKSSDSDAEYRDAVAYYRDIAFHNLAEARRLTREQYDYSIDAPF